MKFEPLRVEGSFAVELEGNGDERGWFSRLFCQNEFASASLDTRIAQVNNSFSAQAGTLRGLHYQTGAHEETKLVRAVSGSVFDVCLDLRPESSTYLSWAGIEVSAANRVMLYVPRGCAHAILTLQDNTELIYFSSKAYEPGSERGARWNDPAFAIEWPREPAVISQKDSSWPLWNAPSAS